MYVIILFAYQIVQEEFLEDINNILNSGEVPNLFEKDELEQVLAAIRPIAKEIGIAEGDRDGVFQHFIARYIRFCYLYGSNHYLYRTGLHYIHDFFFF